MRDESDGMRGGMWGSDGGGGEYGVEGELQWR